MKKIALIALGSLMLMSLATASFAGGGDAGHGRAVVHLRGGDNGHGRGETKLCDGGMHGGGRTIKANLCAGGWISIG